MSETDSNTHKTGFEIAVIGMACRFPGAKNIDEFWQNLSDGRDCITRIPSDRWDLNQYYNADRAAKNTTNSKWLGALDDIDGFDPLFFRISPQEADYIDPQHRLFLQESYRAFEDAGYSSELLSNTKCGVYLGISTNEYASLLERNGVLSAPVTSNRATPIGWLSVASRAVISGCSRTSGPASRSRPAWYGCAWSATGSNRCASPAGSPRCGPTCRGWSPCSRPSGSTSP